MKPINAFLYASGTIMILRLQFSQRSILCRLCKGLVYYQQHKATSFHTMLSLMRATGTPPRIINIGLADKHKTWRAILFFQVEAWPHIHAQRTVQTFVLLFSIIFGMTRQWACVINPHEHQYKTKTEMKCMYATG
jgi:hypothetical protein